MLFHLYHKPCETDAAADQAAAEMRPLIEAEGGTVSVSYAHSHGDAYVVVAVPHGVHPADFDLTEMVGSFTTGDPNTGSTDLEGLVSDADEDI